MLLCFTPDGTAGMNLAMRSREAAVEENCSLLEDGDMESQPHSGKTSRPCNARAVGHASQVNLWYSLRRVPTERGRGEIRFERRCQSQRREAAKLFRCHGCGGRRGRGEGGGGQIFFPLQGSGCPSPSSYLSVPSSSSSSPTSIPFLRAGCEIS